MYTNQQSFHTSNYRGNIQGHDSAYRTDSQQPSGFGYSGNVTSQYRGNQSTFQPTGFVQSVYGQNQSVNAASTFGSAFQGTSQWGANQVQSQYQTPQSFHTANYRGAQPKWGENAQQSQYGQMSSGFGTTGVTSQFGMGQAQSQYQTPQSFHTTNYKGDQIGHDQWKRSDDQGYQSMSSGIGSFQNVSGFGQTQFQSPQSFHTSNYQGNQLGHDQYKRSDSSSPSQYGMNSFGVRSF